ncbi:MAG: hypothetical protein ACRD1T_14070, partial [Acidimicrobiia bacterium]
AHARAAVAAVRPQFEVEMVLYLVELGLNDCQIGRITGIHRRTVMDWRHGKRKTRSFGGPGPCSGCKPGPLDPPTYSYLFGLYLGDGCISEHKRGVFRLRIALDQKYLLRGLVHSDGWRGTNRVKVRGKKYAYPRYQFCNESDEIRAIFCHACDEFGVSWRRMNRRTISIARRADVACLDEVVGMKK